MLEIFKKQIEKNETYYKLFRQDSELPKAPNEVEKYLYRNDDFLLYSFIALFVSVLAVFGQIKWIMEDSGRYPFLISVIIFSLFSFMTYGAGFTKKKFDLKKHNQLRDDYIKSSLQANSKHKYPTVDVYLPTCGEDLEVLENAYKHVSQLEWFNELKVYILDDKNSAEVKNLSDKYNFNYLTRPKPGELKKAGNLRYAFTRSNGDYFVIFDADFCPRSDFLVEAMPYFKKDPKIALLQTPQYFHLTEESNFIEVGSSAKEELFYRCIQPARDTWEAAMCVGTNAIYSREALTPLGGVAPLEHSEDIHTGFWLVSEGWKIKYLPLILAKGMAPSTVNAYFSQQYRWALGTLMQIFDKNFWFAKIPFMIKLNYINSIFYYVNVSTGVIFNIFPVVMTVMLFSNEIKVDEILLFLPLFLFTYVFHPIWQKTPWSIKCVSTNLIANTSYLFAFYDLITGSVMEWIPTGQTVVKQNKKKRYYEFMWFLGVWHFACYGLIYYFTIMNMTGWDDYRMYPVLFFVTFYTIVTLGVFEPVKIIRRLTNSALNFTGLRVFFKQLSSVAIVLFLLFIFSSFTVLAANREGRNYVFNTITSLSFSRNNTNSLIPIPIISVNKDQAKKDEKDNQKILETKTVIPTNTDIKKDDDFKTADPTTKAVIPDPVVEAKPITPDQKTNPIVIKPITPTPITPKPINPTPTPIDPKPIDPVPTPIDPKPIDPTPTPIDPTPTPIDPTPIPIIPKPNP